MTTCESTFVKGECAGHLGKFQSCRDEAIWSESLDQAYWERTTGNVEFRGHFTLMHYGEDTPVATDGASLAEAQTIVTVKAGWYIVEDTNSGAVYVHTTYLLADGVDPMSDVTGVLTEATANAFMDAEDDAYAAWEDS